MKSLNDVGITVGITVASKVCESSWVNVESCCSYFKRSDYFNLVMSRITSFLRLSWFSARWSDIYIQGWALICAKVGLCLWL